MLLVAPVRAEKEIPAPVIITKKDWTNVFLLGGDIPSITHIDYWPGFKVCRKTSSAMGN